MNSKVNTLEPTGVAPHGKLPSADLESDVGSKASALSPTDDSGSVGGSFVRASAPRGGSGAAPPLGTAAGGSSLVHTNGITRPSGQHLVQSVTPPGNKEQLARVRRGHDETWVSSLGPLTADHREALAQRHDTRARSQRAKLHLQGASESEVVEKTKWHTDRAKGQRWRINRVLDCGAEELAVTCPCCGVVSEMSLGCGARLYCFQCRDSYAFRRRGQFLTARADVLAEAEQSHLLDSRRRGGRYGEKFLTLTVPHITDEPVQQRIRRLLDAWPFFLKKFNRNLKERAIRRVEWFRVIEWTEGQGDLQGHPHFHLWIFSPFLHHEELRQMWREALVLSGCSPDSCEHLIIHIEAVRDSQGGVHELIKYLTKDITAGGKKIPAEVYAEVIKALDGSRSTQGSKGFIGRAMKADPACKDCGSTLPKDVRKKRKQIPNKDEATE